MKIHISVPLNLHKTLVITCFIFTLLLGCCIITVAQNPSGNRTTGTAFNIKGKVLDKSGNGLAGATVAEKGPADNATITTTDGSFNLNVHKQESVLVFSHIGFQLNEVSVNGTNPSLTTVSLSPVASSLDDVVVVGYDTQKKTTVTGAVSSVKGAELVKAWVQLYGASPLFNSGSYSVSDPGNLVHFATADPARWANAAASFKKFMDSYTQYSLFAEMDKLWYTANEYNSEVIWDRQNVINVIPNNIDQYGGPVYILGAYHSWGNYDPTQELVDDFRMANGKRISDPTSGYDARKPYMGN